MSFRGRLLPFAVLLFVLPFPGTVAFRLLALAGGLIVCAFVWHREGFPEIPARTALLLLIACALLSLATAVDAEYSLGEIKNELGYAMAAYLGFLTLTRTLADARVFVAALILGSLALSAAALREHFFSDSGLWIEGGLAGGSGSYSTYVLTLMPVLLWAGCVFQHRHRWVAVAGLVFSQLLLASLTGQRAFWAAFVLQAVFALYLLRARGFIAISNARVGIMGMTVLVFSVLVVVSASTKREQSIDAWIQDPRINVWSQVVERIRQYPLAGKGFGRNTMKNAYPEIRPKDFTAVWHPHNTFLNYGVAMGLPGMLLLILVFFVLLRSFWRLSRVQDRVIAMAGICGVLLVVGVVTRNLANDFFQRDLALLFWAIAGMLLGYGNHAKHEAKSKP